MPDAPALAFVLALSNEDSPMLLWLLAGALMALGPVIHSYIRVYDWFKGKNIDTSEFVTHKQLAVIKAERDTQLAASVGEIKSDVASIEKKMDEMAKDFAAIHRALGRVEGHDEADLRGSARRPR